MSKNDVIVGDMVDVPVEELTFYRDNPRVGNVEVIAESLKENGQFRPLVVNKGTLTGVANEVLAGNHTLKGIIFNKWPTAKVAFIDVDDEAALKIVIADNRTSDLASYDPEILKSVLSKVTSAVGTGFDQDALDKIREATTASISAAQGVAAEALSSLGLAEYDADDYAVSDDVYGEDDDIEDYEDDSPVELTDEEIAHIELNPFDADNLAQLQSIVTLNEDMDLKGKNSLDIPDLRKDMLAPKFDRSIFTWAGHAASEPDNDGKCWFLWNYGTCSSKNLLPLADDISAGDMKMADRTILSFFTWDEKFENWYAEPGYQTSKAMHMGIKVAIVPDFSMYNVFPAALWHYNYYRANYLGRFFQEAGIRVIPRLQWGDNRTDDVALLGIPKNCPVVATSIQNVGKRSDPKDSEGLTEAARMIRGQLIYALEKLTPEQVLVYGGNPSKRIIESLKNLRPDIASSVDFVHIPNYADVRRNRVFDKKEGAGSNAKARKMTQNRVQDDDLDDDDDDYDDDF